VSCLNNEKRRQTAL